MTPQRKRMAVAHTADLSAEIVRQRATQRVSPMLLVMSALGVGVASGSPSPPQSISRSDLCVTEGAIDEHPESHRFIVDSPKMRAYVNDKPVKSIEARFVYLGATSREVALGSGTMRRQFGFKLHAQDACNLIYAMWRIEPESKLVVSIKENLGQQLSTECGNHGYRNIKPQRSATIPTLRPGDSHTLRAEMTATMMSIYVDQMLAWQGPLSADVLKWDDRVGIRSDNVRMQFDLTAPIARENFGNQECGSEPYDTE
jgi:hypothetical protein